MVADEAEGQIFLPCAERDVGEPLARGRDGARLRNVDLRRRGEAHRAQRRRPVELRRQLRELGAGHWVMRGDRIAAPLGRPLILRQAGFERDDPVGAPFGVGQAGELAELDDIVAVGASDGVVFLALEQVIIAGREAEPRLAGDGGVAGRIVLVGADADIDRAA